MWSGPAAGARAALAVALVLGVASCSGPTADVSQALSSTSAAASEGAPVPDSPASGPGGAADLPAPAGVLPAPDQREPTTASPPSSASPSPSTPTSASSSSSSAAPPTPAASATASPSAGDGHSDAGAVDVVVNKRRPLQPLDYTPADLRQPNVATSTDNGLLRPDTASAVEEMFAAAAADGVGLVLASGYRSYANQESTYAYWVSQYGDAAGADTVSARPGYSEHQTGLSFDIAQSDGACTLVSCFADTAAARWAAANAAEYGIILRYPLGFDGITGFSAEPWHFRYVGRDVAQAMEAAGTQTLEEHFGLPAAPSY